MSQVAAIHARDKGRCWICERKMPITEASRDHQRPRGEGGGDHARNYRLADRLCNSARGRLPVAEVEKIKAVMKAERGYVWSADVLRQRIRFANGEYMRSEIAAGRAVPSRAERFFANREAMKSGRRAAKAARRVARGG